VVVGASYELHLRWSVVALAPAPILAVIAYRHPRSAAWPAAVSRRCIAAVLVCDDAVTSDRIARGSPHRCCVAAAFTRQRCRRDGRSAPQIDQRTAGGHSRQARACSM